MKVKLYEIATLNKANYDFKHKHTSILYLDTANITRNQITEFKEYAYKSVDIPSRAKRAVENGTIIISTVRPNLEHYGFLENSAENTVVSTGFVTIDADKTKVDPRYLYYILTAPKTIAYLTAIATTGVSSYPSFNPDDLGNYELDILDSLKEQKRIANVLSSIDSKISLNNLIVSELESLAKQIYDYWFVQFDFPDEHGRPYKSSGGKMVWNADLKRHIPKDWEVKTLGEIEENIITGKTPSTKEEQYYGGTIPFVTIDDIRGNIYVVNTAKTLTTQGAETQKNKYLPAESLCVTCIATIGLVGFTTAMVSQTNQQINSIVFQNNDNKAYLYFALKDYFTSNFGAKTGNTFANMNKEEFSSIRLIYSEDTIKYFSITISKIFERIKFCLEENRTLTSLRDFLLPMLINGQVTVGE